ENPDVLRQFQVRFRFILVDEYQDTNVAQYLWLRLLAQAPSSKQTTASLPGLTRQSISSAEDGSPGLDAARPPGDDTQASGEAPTPPKPHVKNICCVGDDDQSIYGWRGAEVDNILRFEHDFPGARIIRLERNYRSTGHILAAASHLIAH